MKKNKMFSQKDIKIVLKYAHDLSTLENEFRGLANAVLDLEIKKKELNTQLLDLRYLIDQHQNAIDMKRERLSKMEAYLSQPAIHSGPKSGMAS